MPADSILSFVFHFLTLDENIDGNLSVKSSQEDHLDVKSSQEDHLTGIIEKGFGRLEGKPG